MASGLRWPWSCWPHSMFDRLLQGPTRFTELPAAMPRILAPGGLCHVISYGDE